MIDIRMLTGEQVTVSSGMDEAEDKSNMDDEAGIVRKGVIEWQKMALLTLV